MNDSSTYHDYGAPVVGVMVGVILIVMVLTVAGNVMVILTVVRHRGMRTRTNMFLVNLAVADILVAVFNMPVSLITLIRGDWIFGRVFCQISGFSMAVFLICSIQTLMCISVHKYVSITRPFSRTMTPEKILTMIAAIWIWSVLCGMSPLLGWNTIVYKKGSSQCGPSLPNSWLQYSHSIFINTTNYIVPLCVMSFCYFHIFREINRHLQRIRKTSNVDLDESVSQQKKITVTLVLVLACFLLCWTPFIVYSSAVSILKDKSKMPSIINPVAYWCGYLNSACNPVIYALRSPSFRQGYREIMCEYVPVDNGRAGGGISGRAGRSGTAFSAPCTPATGRTRLAVPAAKKTLLSDTAWASLPLLSVRPCHPDSSGGMPHPPTSLETKAVVPVGISGNPTSDRVEELRSGEERSSSERSSAAATPSGSPGCFRRTQFRSRYRAHRASPTVTQKFASVDRLDVLFPEKAGIWTSRISLRRKKRRWTAYPIPKKENVLQEALSRNSDEGISAKNSDNSDGKNNRIKE
ncbi:alpha-2 adrenergic receptor-like [Centruroides sculpturatus]|uniref:alpha-2 adrenergic receptor-like n=1 Tax=Centruroides sculpturatus TaxID=218467 RepID=UPI000C6E61BB|nr:alpha-2 adrenergic receptor-like [Centruroides sculpturatus]XP_023223923.1 alpha-2 adrenergic receptor-like [Centruroides sculpturatus]